MQPAKLFCPELELWIVKCDPSFNKEPQNPAVTIYGNGGNHIIPAGSGNDVIYGGDGADAIQENQHSRRSFDEEWRPADHANDWAVAR